MVIIPFRLVADRSVGLPVSAFYVAAAVSVTRRRTWNPQYVTVRPTDGDNSDVSFIIRGKA